MADKASGAPAINEFVVLENSETMRHLVVCTVVLLLSAADSGRPPDWFKSFNYRQRTVRDTRGVMREFGLDLAPDVEVCVHDSTPNAWFTASARISQFDKGCSL
jgi:nitrile hydratase subunit alpha